MLLLFFQKIMTTTNTNKTNNALKFGTRNSTVNSCMIFRNMKRTVKRKRRNALCRWQTSVKLKIKPRQPTILTAWCKWASMTSWQFVSGHCKSDTSAVAFAFSSLWFSLQHVAFGFCSHCFIWSTWRNNVTIHCRWTLSTVHAQIKQYPILTRFHNVQFCIIYHLNICTSH